MQGVARSSLREGRMSHSNIRISYYATGTHQYLGRGANLAPFGLVVPQGRMTL